jgi:hypothetical protein
VNILETALSTSIGKMQHAINLLASQVGVPQDCAVPISEMGLAAKDTDDDQMETTFDQSEIQPRIGSSVKSNIVDGGDLISKSIISQKEAESLYDL